jgi:hypothetical protein
MTVYRAPGHVTPGVEGRCAGLCAVCVGSRGRGGGSEREVPAGKPTGSVACGPIAFSHTGRVAQVSYHRGRHL